MTNRPRSSRTASTKQSVREAAPRQADNASLAKSPIERPFIVVAPSYDHRSMGIRILHILCNELNRCGREAYLIHYCFRPEGGQDFFTTDGVTGYCSEHSLIRRLPLSGNVEDFRSLIDRAYVIYPEVMQGNPLNAPRIIRYVLNNPAANRYPMLHGDNDFIVSFHPSYWGTPDFLLPLFVSDDCFNDAATVPPLERRMDSTYIGKGHKFGDCFKIPGSVMIERVWPSDKESLAVLMQNTRYFFTWDLVSAIITEAVRCGAIPVVLRWEPYTPAIFETEFGTIPHADIRIRGAALQVNIDFEHYFQTRDKYLAGYETKVRVGNLDNISRMAHAVDTHFA